MHYLVALFSQPFSHHQLAVSSWSPKCRGTALKFDAFRKCHFPFSSQSFHWLTVVFTLRLIHSGTFSWKHHTFLLLFAKNVIAGIGADCQTTKLAVFVCSTAADFEADHEKCWYITRAKLLHLCYKYYSASAHWQNMYTFTKHTHTRHIVNSRDQIRRNPRPFPFSFFVIF